MVAAQTPVETLRDQMLSLTADERREFLNTLPNEQASRILHDWSVWARPEQLAPTGSWRTWIFMGGRGSGKTRAAAEWVRGKVERGEAGRIALISDTAADCRDIVVEGESGILAISPPWNRPKYEPSKRRLTWDNGAIATLYSSEVPDALRGPQHDLVWGDEIAKWTRGVDTWNMAAFGLRLGSNPQFCATTTPRPVPLIKRLVQRMKSKHSRIVTTTGTMYDNIDYLAPDFVADIEFEYAGTRIGAQEIYGRLLLDSPAALWSRDNLEATRLGAHEISRLVFDRIVIGVDPGISSDENAAETGIIAAGKRLTHGYTLEDCSLRGTPTQWASAVVGAYFRWKADCIVAEANQGGEMVKSTIHTVDPTVNVKLVHASRGKLTRAEPVAALFEQGRGHMVGMFETLEDELCEWVPGNDSPNHLDALVWAYTDLMLGYQTPNVESIISMEMANQFDVERDLL